MTKFIEAIKKNPIEPGQMFHLLRESLAELSFIAKITSDNKLPEGFELKEQRLDETEVGEGTAIVLIDAKRPEQWRETTNTADCAEWLGLEPLHGFLDWDLFEAVLTPGDIILLIIFKDQVAAEEFMGSVMLPGEARMRSIRVIRDYSMFDRREAPQYYPEVHPSETEPMK